MAPSRHDWKIVDWEPQHNQIYIQNFKPPPSFSGCAGRFVSYLVANPEDRFTHDKAHFRITTTIFGVSKFFRIQYTYYSSSICMQSGIHAIIFLPQLSQDLIPLTKLIQFPNNNKNIKSYLKFLHYLYNSISHIVDISIPNWSMYQYILVDINMYWTAVIVFYLILVGHPISYVNKIFFLSLRLYYLAVLIILDGTCLYSFAFRIVCGFSNVFDCGFLNKKKLFGIIYF